MQPTFDQRDRLRNAILDAYDFEALNAMLVTQLDTDLQCVVPFVTTNLTQ